MNKEIPLNGAAKEAGSGRGQRRVGKVLEGSRMGVVEMGGSMCCIGIGWEGGRNIKRSHRAAY